MNTLQVIILAIVQGATEFIPVSSSGHLVIAREMLGWSDDFGVMFDTVLHAGSLLAVLVYFWKEWKQWLLSYRSVDRSDENLFYRRLPLLLLVATIPVILSAPFLVPRLMEQVRTAKTTGIVMLAAGMWFFFCEYRKGSGARFTFITALVMGIAQVFALLPGASRSGLTTGAGMLMGQRRDQAAKFAFFMLLPAIGGAIVYELPEIVQCTASGFPLAHLLTGFIACFITSLLCIHFCLTFFRKHGLYVFAAYLLIAGLLLVVAA